MLFASDHYLACLIGVLTDGPIFLLTWFLWFLSRPADQYLDRREEDIVAAIGDALMPPGGAFSTGFVDVRRECLADIRRSLGALAPMSLFGTRFFLRALDVAPILAGMRFRTLLKVSRAERSALLTRLESHRWWMFRAMVMAVKTIIIMAFFNQPGVSGAVGYDPDARIKS